MTQSGKTHSIHSIPTTPNLPIASPHFVHSSSVTLELANHPGTTGPFRKICIELPDLDDTHTISCMELRQSVVPCQGFNGTSMSGDGSELPQGGCRFAHDGGKVPESRKVSGVGSSDRQENLYQIRTALSEDPDTRTPSGGMTRRLFTKSIWADVVESTSLVYRSINKVAPRSRGKTDSPRYPKL